MQTIHRMKLYCAVFTSIATSLFVHFVLFVESTARDNNVCGESLRQVRNLTVPKLDKIKRFSFYNNQSRRTNN